MKYLVKCKDCFMYEGSAVYVEGREPIFTFDILNLATVLRHANRILEVTDVHGNEYRIATEKIQMICHATIGNIVMENGKDYYVKLRANDLLRKLDSNALALSNVIYYEEDNQLVKCCEFGYSNYLVIPNTF